MSPPTDGETPAMPPRPSSLLVLAQRFRGAFRWDYIELPVSEPGADPENAIELMRWFEMARRGRGFTLYSLVACDYDMPGIDPSTRWQRPKRKECANDAEFKERNEAVRAERNKYLSDPARWSFAYRFALDMDTRSREDWPETRRVALELRRIFEELTGGATLDAYSSGGSKCGLHLEAPAGLQHLHGSKAHQAFARDLARLVGVPLVSQREKRDERPDVALEIDDTILGKIPCGSLLTAPGPRMEWITGERRAQETGIGKVWLPRDVLDRLEKPEDLEAFVREQRAKGDDAIVPPWLKPDATPAELATVREVAPAFFTPYLAKLEEGAKPASSTTSRNTTHGSGPSATPPPGADPDVFARLRRGVDLIADSPEKWKWLGKLAKKLGVAEHVRQLSVSDDAKKFFDEGVACSESVARPTQDDALLGRVRRAMVALGRPPAPSVHGGGDGDSDDDEGIGVEIVELVRRTPGYGRGARFDLVVATPMGTAKLVGLSGKDVLSYNAVAAASAEEGVVLPFLGKRANQLWRDVLAEASTRERVEAPAPGERVDDAIEGELRRFLRDAPLAECPDDLDSGAVLVQDGHVLVKPGVVMQAVRQSLPDDRPEREKVVEVARLLGLAEERPRLEDGSQPRLWRFPAPLRGAADAPAPAPSPEPPATPPGPPGGTS